MCLVKLHMYLTFDLAHLGRVKLHMCSVILHMYLTLDLGLVKVEEQDYVDSFSPVSAEKVWTNLGPEAQTKQELEWHLDYPRWAFLFSTDLAARSMLGFRVQTNNDSAAELRRVSFTRSANTTRIKR